mmetsp:Transcript_19384/g.58578  ORF Transcript_19384/g.58578 Transcript_19384/m.58578 type:complete len:296 (-) Transcript_19384:173-1060(-)
MCTHLKLTLHSLTGLWGLPRGLPPQRKPPWQTGGRPVAAGQVRVQRRAGPPRRTSISPSSSRSRLCVCPCTSGPGRTGRRSVAAVPGAVRTRSRPWLCGTIPLAWSWGYSCRRLGPGEEGRFRPLRTAPAASCTPPPAPLSWALMAAAAAPSHYGKGRLRWVCRSVAARMSRAAVAVGRAAAPAAFPRRRPRAAGAAAAAARRRLCAAMHSGWGRPRWCGWRCIPPWRVPCSLAPRCRAPWTSERAGRVPMELPRRDAPRCWCCWRARRRWRRSGTPPHAPAAASSAGCGTSGRS